MTLSSSLSIKDSHLASLDGDAAKAVSRAWAVVPKSVKIEVKCDNIEHVVCAVDAGADVILLDDMSTTSLAECVKAVNRRAILQASGAATLSSLPADRQRRRTPLREVVAIHAALRSAQPRLICLQAVQTNLHLRRGASPRAYSGG